MGTKEAAKKARPASMYFLVNEDGELCGPLDKFSLNDEIDGRIDYAGLEEIQAFVISYDGEKLVYQEIIVEERQSFALTTDLREQYV